MQRADKAIDRVLCCYIDWCRKERDLPCDTGDVRNDSRFLLSQEM